MTRNQFEQFLYSECEYCGGRGKITPYRPTLQGSHQCSRCQGRGKSVTPLGHAILGFIRGHVHTNDAGEIVVSEFPKE